jgi:membrane associated rhomboid family serine protease
LANELFAYFALRTANIYESVPYLQVLLLKAMFPYRDENETQHTPYITIAIIALNVLVWIFIQGAGSTMSLGASVCNLGLIPGELTGTVPPETRLEMGDGMVCLTDSGRQPFHLITSMFLHGSWMHLLGNMWFFWLFGNNIEDSMGKTRFIVFYLLSGFAAAGLQVFLTPMSNIPMVGASGAISGIMGAYLVLYPRVRVFAFIPLGFFATTVALPAWAMLGYWMLLQFFGGLQSLGATGGGTAFWAHVGGFVAGVALIKLFARKDYVREHKAHHYRPRRVGWGR